VTSVCMNTIFITDQVGLKSARYSIASFVETQAPGSSITLYCDGFTLEPNDVLNSISRSRGFHFQAKTISSAAFSKEPTSQHISAATFLKFSAAVDASRDFKRVLYSDTDVLYFVRADFEGFNLREQPLAAAYDVAETTSITDPQFKENCDRNEVSSRYFNAGLLLIDSIKCNLEKLEQEYVSLVRSRRAFCPYKSDCTTGDQCVWNLMFENRWCPLPISLNVQSSMRFTDYWTNAAVRHYTGPIKFLPVRPWRSDSREVRYLKRLAALLGEEAPRSRVPGDVAYKLNALRWRKSIKRIDKSVLEVDQWVKALSTE